MSNSKWHKVNRLDRPTNGSLILMRFNNNNKPYGVNSPIICAVGVYNWYEELHQAELRLATDEYIIITDFENEVKEWIPVKCI